MWLRWEAQNCHKKMKSFCKRNSLYCKATKLSLFHKMPKCLFKEDFVWFIMLLLPVSHERFACFLQSFHWAISILTIIFNFIYCEGKNPAWNVNIFVSYPWFMVKTRSHGDVTALIFPMLTFFHALNQHCSSNGIEILHHVSVHNWSLWVQTVTTFCLSSWQEIRLHRTVCSGPT